MDPRQQQQQQQQQQQPPPLSQQSVFAPRQQERPLIHNPNHSTPPQAQHSQYSYQPTSVSQPPVHVPFTDPFPRHDPFLPNSQQQRRSSYGMNKENNHPGPAERPASSSWGSGGTHQLNTVNAVHPLHPVHPHSQSGPPPPPPTSAGHTSAAQAPFPYNSSRRRSLGDANGSRYPPPVRDGPPPPSFTTRQMLPPSPQSQKQSAPLSGPRSGPSASFGGSRELPGLGSGHRPGSSMSISSLIGGEGTGSQQSAQASPPTSTMAHSPTNASMQPPSPMRGGASGRTEFGSYKGQPSPDKHTSGGPSSARSSDGNGYPAGSPPRGYASGTNSPELVRSVAPFSAQHKQANSTNQKSPIYHPNTTNEGIENIPRRQMSNGIPPRPISQPSTLGDSRSGADYRGMYDPMRARRPSTSQSPEERRKTLGDYAAIKPSDPPGLATQPQAERERPVTAHPVSQSAFTPPRENLHSGHISTQAKPGQPPSYWRSNRREEDQRDANREEHSQLYRHSYGPHPPSMSQSPHGPDEMPRPLSGLDHLGHHRIVEQYHAPPTSDPSSIDKVRLERSALSPFANNHSHLGRGSTYDPMSRKFGEELQPTKSFLGLGPEANRRTGRASPLPQAVQGAQAQPMGPGGDPSIKSEFGRMFSGLGSGLSSSRSGNGTTTPSRQSPLPHNREDPLHSSDIPAPPELVRVNSQSGRRVRRIKDEDGPFDSESGDGRGTPLLGGSRGSKRPKHNHPSHHHHHHHVQGHHHHHHHHKTDEDSGPGNTSVSNNATSSFNTTRHSHSHAAPPNGSATQPGPHHIHYHPAPHHHHHVPKANQSAPIPSSQIPARTVHIQSVLDTVAQLPRDHLGSRLYETEVALPPPTTPLDDKFGYSSRFKSPTALSADKGNCTITIRVPRYFLRAKEREQICRQRQVWGTGVYREDSDPVAAAIHSGWIRGAWNEDVNVELLDPRILGTKGPNDAEETLVAKPGAPVEPPLDMDLHITLLILPGLEEYHSRVEYGLKSRASHDDNGMSFMVYKVQWVDEGTGTRGLERGAAARKRRLDAGNALVSLAIGRPLNGEMTGGNHLIRA